MTAGTITSPTAVRGMTMADDARLAPHLFAPADPDAWRELATRAAKGQSPETLASRTLEDIPIAPLYWAAERSLAARSHAGPDPNRPWACLALADGPSPALAAQQAQEALEGGAAGLVLRLDPTGQDGAVIVSQDDMAMALDGVLLDAAPVALDAGWLGPQAADWLSVVAKGAPRAALSFHLDPLSLFAQTGSSPGPIEAHVAAAANVAVRHAEAYPQARLMLASGRVAHETGGAEAQEIAFAAAAAVAYLRALESAGMPLDQAFGRVTIGLGVDADVMVGIAKLRAMRAVWANLAQACGVASDARIEARASRRMLSRLDPWVNLLRQTAAVFAGAVGGADAILVEPFTRPLGGESPLARRQSRNIQLILMEEAGLGRVDDPAGGAYAIESLSVAMAEQAWARLQAIEAAGGLAAALRSGVVAAEADRTRAERFEATGRRKIRILGVSEHPDPRGALPETTPRPEHERPAAMPEIARTGEDSACPPLPPVRDSEAFEALAERARGLQAGLLPLGGPDEHAPRMAFAAAALAAVGLSSRTLSADDFSHVCDVVVLCGADSAYEAQAEEAAQILKAHGARKILIAGRPGEAARRHMAAGVDGHLFAGENLITLFSDILAGLEARR